MERPLPGILLCYPEAQVQQADEEWSEIDAVLCLDTDSHARRDIAARAQRRQSKIVEFVSHEFGESEIDRARKANAYVMLQYTRGRSGLRPNRDPKLAARLNRLRDEGVTLPIFAGIGVSTVEQARQAMDHGADGVVIGSKAVQMAERLWKITCRKPGRRSIMAGLFLGTDVGTTSVKAAILDSAGRCLANFSETHPMRRPEASFAEQNPSD